jgi:hypothetical protein
MHVCCIFACSHIVYSCLVSYHSMMQYLLCLPQKLLYLVVMLGRAFMNITFLHAILQFILINWLNNAISAPSTKKDFEQVSNAFICVEFLHAFIRFILILFHPIQMTQNLLFLSKIFHHLVVAEKVSKCIHKYYIFTFL